RECIGGGAGKPGQDLVVVQAAYFACRALADGVAQGDLAVAAQGDVFAAAHANNGGGVKVVHVYSVEPCSWGRRREFQGWISPNPDAERVLRLDRCYTRAVLYGRRRGARLVPPSALILKIKQRHPCTTSFKPWPRFLLAPP